MNAQRRTYGLPMLALVFASACRSAPSEETAELRALGEDAATWIRRGAHRSDDGTRWSADPERSGSPDSSIYGGSPGVVLFLSVLPASIGESSQELRSGADALVAD